MIIAFGKTSAALLAGKKTVTRRIWKESHARKFQAGQLADAWNNSPRVRGARKIGMIRITQAPYRERLKDMPVDDLEKEGGLWETREEFIDLFGGPEVEVWVVRFELISIE